MNTEVQKGIPITLNADEVKRVVEEIGLEQAIKQSKESIEKAIRIILAPPQSQQ